MGRKLGSSSPINPPNANCMRCIMPGASVFPPLKQCRAKWLQRFPDTVWRDPTANAWRGERDDDDDD